MASDDAAKVGFESALKVKRLPLGEFTMDGPFWAEVEGHRVGEDRQCFWQSEAEAKAAAFRWWMKRNNVRG